MLALCAAACGSDGTYEGATLKLAVAAHSTEPEIAAPGTSSSGLGVERALLSVRELALGGCGDVAPIAATNRTLDLLADPADQLWFDTAVVEYCGLELSLGAQAGGPTELEGRALALRGTRADGTTVELSISAERELGLVAAQPFDAHQLLLGVDLGAWFESVDLEGATADDDGVVRVSETSNFAAHEQFATGLDRAVQLFSDANGNGRLDDDERTPLATTE